MYLATHRSRHCVFVRPGTILATATQSVPCFFTASVSCVSSSVDHLPVFFPLAGSSTSTHRSRHCVFVRPGTIAATATQSLPCFFTASVSFPASSGFYLPAFFPLLEEPKEHGSIVHDTAYSFDRGPSQSLRPNLWCHVSSPLWPAFRLLLVPTYPSPSRCWKGPNN